MPYAPDLSGRALDERYELHAPIGEGAFGRVYQGRDRRLDRTVAVKVIKPWWTEDPEWVETFERETKLLARVSDPGIVQIFDVGHAPEGLYYVSELVDGEDLARRLRHGPLPPWQACAIAGQLCRALARAHQKRIVHRDVKPANILLSRDGRVKVGDFGVARLAEGSDAHGSHPGMAATIVGTPRYMSPEQGCGRPTTPATDVYSVGVVLYEMLAGEPPFTGGSVVELALSHVREAPPPLSADLPASLVAIVARALAKDPTHRFANGGEMADALLGARRQAADRSRRPANARARMRAHAPAISDPIPGRFTATALLEPRSSPSRARSLPPRRPADETRAAPPPLPPRRNVNPPARRRAIGAFFAVVLLLAAMATAAALLGHRHTRVPRLTGLSRAVARARARHLHPVVSLGYSSAAKGTVFAQRPRAGTRVTVGARVRLMVSRGPAPVEVPVVSEASGAAAGAAFSRMGLHTTVTPIAAPGVAPGTVIRTSPGAGRHVAKGTTVALFVAETPRWRPLTTIVNSRPVLVRIQGTRWRVVYAMAYHGTCTWILFCSGPHVRISTANGASVASFGMNDGGTQVQTFSTKPDTYQVRVTPGGDEARWSMQVQDDY